MCLLPCWPCSDVFLEEEPKKGKESGVLVYDPNAKAVVEIIGQIPVSFSSVLPGANVKLLLVSWEVEDPALHLHRFVSSRV